MARMIGSWRSERTRAPTQRTAERFTRIYVPIVLLSVAAIIVVPRCSAG